MPSPDYEFGTDPKPGKERKSRNGMGDGELLAVLREEETDASSYYTSELALAQAEAMERYNGRPYGDEKEGRSRVVTHDIEDTINWIMPHLMRLYLQNDDLITIEDERVVDPREAADQDRVCKDAADYVAHAFFKDNAGEEVLHDFAFDGLLQRVGVVRVSWEDPKPTPSKVLKNVSPDKLANYLHDPEYEIEEQESELDEATGVELFTIKVKHTPKCGRLCIEPVAPEEFAISRRAKSIEASSYHRRKTEEYLSELALAFPKKRHELDPENYSGPQDDQIDDLDTDPRRQARFEDENYDIHSDHSKHERRRKVDLLTEYVRVDYDGDGVVELRQIKRVGNTILENIEVDESEFVVWSPIRVAHRMVGRSLADTLYDLQKIRTVLTRKLLDGLSQSLAPRAIADVNKLGEEGIDALLDQDIGDVIPAKGNPREAVHELTTPDVSSSAYQALEYMDQRSEEASGVTRHAQGLKAEAITDTDRGIARLQAAANARIELVARWMALGVERIFNRALRQLARYQDVPRTIKVNGRPLTIDPRFWSDEMTCSVHVGQAAESRNEKLQKLSHIAEKQEQILLQAPSNPIVSLKEYRHTLGAMVREAGYKDDTKFFMEIPDDYQPAEPEDTPDPKLVEAQQKAQLQAAELEHKQKLSEAEFTHKSQLEAMRLQSDQQIASAKAETERQLAIMKQENERQIAQMRIEAETQIAAKRLQAEQELARWKASEEAKLAKSNASIKAKQNGATNGKGYRSGGDLSK